MNLGCRSAGTDVRSGTVHAERLVTQAAVRAPGPAAVRAAFLGVRVEGEPGQGRGAAWQPPRAQPTAPRLTRSVPHSRQNDCVCACVSVYMQHALVWLHGGVKWCVCVCVCVCKHVHL